MEIQKERLVRMLSDVRYTSSVDGRQRRFKEHHRRALAGWTWDHRHRVADTLIREPNGFVVDGLEDADGRCPIWHTREAALEYRAGEVSYLGQSDPDGPVRRESDSEIKPVWIGHPVRRDGDGGGGFVEEYLDEAIRYWRRKRDARIEGTEPHLMATCYVDAFQSVRSSVLGDVLPWDSDGDSDTGYWEIEVDVVGCARCSEDHDGVPFERLRLPVGEWTHVGACPDREEPIFLRQVVGTVVGAVGIGGDHG